MNEYEKYQLRWMLDHNHSIREMITRLGEIAFNEMSNDVSLSFDKIMDEVFEIFEYEQGFKNEEIWLCKDEWEHDLYSSNEYSLTDAGKTKVKHFIENCRIKQDSILKAGLDTAKETTLPSVEDILCNVEDMVDEDGKYTNAWNITDNYLSDPLEMHKDDDFVIHSNEQVKDVLIPLPLVVKETPLPPSYEVSTSQPHYTEVNLFDVSDDVFHEEDTNDFSPWSDRSINNILRIGSGFVNGKYRIYHLYTAMNVNAKDKAIFLKNEYGIGGQTYDFKNKKQDKGYIDHDYKENKFVGRFMRADVLIGLGLAGEGIVIKLKTPLRTINVDSVNPVGRVNFNRMYKRINDIRYSLNKTIETIQNYEGNLNIAKEMVNKPFELQDELTSARNRQKEINKILDTSGNENSKVVVEDDLEEERNESCMEL